MKKIIKIIAAVIVAFLGIFTVGTISYNQYNYWFNPYYSTVHRSQEGFVPYTNKVKKRTGDYVTGDQIWLKYKVYQLKKRWKADGFHYSGTFLVARGKVVDPLKITFDDGDEGYTISAQVKGKKVVISYFYTGGNEWYDLDATYEVNKDGQLTLKTYKGIEREDGEYGKEVPIKFVPQDIKHFAKVISKNGMVKYLIHNYSHDMYRWF
ncbi:MAG: hypothetical protein LBM27_05290 [Lactobacillaceae bacterium]|jgi:hypothetical protein|nr:hypothetical protein [Lactobacillaceae bacterium]